MVEQMLNLVSSFNVLERKVWEQNIRNLTETPSEYMLLTSRLLLASEIDDNTNRKMTEEISLLKKRRLL